MRDREDVVIACVHTADQFKNSVLIPDWLVSHGGWNGVADMTESIARDEKLESSEKNWRDILPGAAVLASGMAALGFAVLAKR